MALSTKARKRLELMLTSRVQAAELADAIDAGAPVPFTLTVSCDTAGVAGNKTITGDGVSTCATLIGAGYTIAAGGATILRHGVAVAIAGGLDAIAAAFNGTINVEGGGTDTLTVVCSTPGVAGNISITGDGLTDCATLIGAGYNITAGGAVILKNGDVVNIAGGADAVAASFNGSTYAEGPAVSAFSAKLKKRLIVGLANKLVAQQVEAIVVQRVGNLTDKARGVIRAAVAHKVIGNEIADAIDLCS